MPDSSHSSCIEVLTAHVHPGNWVGVLRTDSTIIEGTLTSLYSADGRFALGLLVRDTAKVSSHLYVSTGGTYVPITVPLEDISSVRYRKNRASSTILGGLIGAAAGALIGVALAPEEREHGVWDFDVFDDPGFTYPVAGGALGFLVGLVIGLQLAPTATVPCR